MVNTVNNFTMIESSYGKFVVNRHCAFQAEHLIKTGVPHIESELRPMLAVVDTLVPGSIVVDAGANVGLVSVPIAQAVKTKDIVVHAFEVQRMMFYALCGAAALNDLDNLVVHHLGVGARNEELMVPMVNYGTPQDFGTLSLTGQSAEGTGEVVSIVALDNFDLPRLDFLKIDIEGMEVEALHGARHMIKTYQPWCWVEYWISGIDAIRREFDGVPYDFYRMDQLNMLCAPRSRNVGIHIGGERL